MGLGSTLSFRMTLWVRKDKGGEASRSCSHSHSQSGAEFSTSWATEGGAVILLGRHTLTGGSQADITRWAVLGNLQELGIKKSLGLGSPIGLVEVFSALKNILETGEGWLPWRCLEQVVGCFSDVVMMRLTMSSGTKGGQYKGQS